VEGKKKKSQRFLLKRGEGEGKEKREGPCRKKTKSKKRGGAAQGRDPAMEEGKRRYE